MSDEYVTAPYDGVSEWWCTECGHVHTGIDLAYICIGCACPFIPSHATVDTFFAQTDALFT